MLFSGSVKSYKCSSCGSNFCAVTPTSVIPILITVMMATIIWTGNITQYFALKSVALLLAFLIGAALAIGSFSLSFVLLQGAFSGWEKSRKCPQCGGELEGVSGGFIDGGAPSLQELILYAIVLAVPIGLAFLIGW